MTIEQLADLFASGIQTKKTLRINTIHQCNVKLAASRYMVYSYTALPLLIDKMRAYRHDDEWGDQGLQFIVRYIIEETGAMWFALEGRPGTSIPRERSDQGQLNQGEVVPAHSDMTWNRCIAAGNIEFSEDYCFVKKISNKSLHFTPTPETMVWTVDALRTLGAKIAEEVQLDFWSTSSCGRTTCETVSLSKEELYGLSPAGNLLVTNPDHTVRVYSDDTGVSFDENNPPRMLPIHSPSGAAYSSRQGIISSKGFFSTATNSSVRALQLPLKRVLEANHTENPSAIVPKITLTKDSASGSSCSSQTPNFFVQVPKKSLSPKRYDSPVSDVSHAASHSRTF
jgi:hypothetical protein